MAVTEKISCDVCGKEKQQVNHWYLLRVQNETVSLSAWAELTITLKDYQHLCGQECVTKAINSWMQSQAAGKQ